MRRVHRGRSDRAARARALRPRRPRRAARGGDRGVGLEQRRPGRVDRAGPAARRSHRRARPRRSTSSRRGGRVLSRPDGRRRCSRCTSTSPGWRAPRAATCSTPAKPDRSAPRGAPSVWSWWVGGVAVLTDGDALLADAGIEAFDELLFTVPVPRPRRRRPRVRGRRAARRASKWSRSPTSTRSRSGSRRAADCR